MCIICIDFERGALRPQEARRALREMRSSLDAEHAQQIERAIDKQLELGDREPASSKAPGS